MVHFFPAAFTISCIILILLPFISWKLFWVGAAFFIVYKSLIFIDSWQKSGSIKVAYLSVVAAFVQLFAYGMGFLKELIFGKNTNQ